MSPRSMPENPIRRLFRECETHQRHDQTAVGREAKFGLEESLASSLSRVEGAAAEMERLRAMATSQQDLIYEQKKDLAAVRREVGDALDQAVRSDKLYLAEKIRAELAEARAEQFEREIAALRTQVGRLTAAVNRSFDRDTKVPGLRVVA